MSSEKIKNSFWFRHFLMCHHLANKNIKLGKVLNFANCILQEEQGKVANSQMTYHFWVADSFLCELHCSDQGTVFDNLEDEEDLPLSKLADLSSMELYEYYENYCVGQIDFNPNKTKSTQEKAMFWLANGEVGSSSKTIFDCLIGYKDFKINHPRDPDDFRRCWQLLQAVPEWKFELYKLKPLSKQWSKLVDNWLKLVDYCERWCQDKKAEGLYQSMYQFMQTLIA